MTKDEREALRESLDTMEFFDKNDIRSLLDAADERDRSNARIIELLEGKLVLRAVAEQAREALVGRGGRDVSKALAALDAVLKEK